MAEHPEVAKIGHLRALFDFIRVQTLQQVDGWPAL